MYHFKKVASAATCLNIPQIIRLSQIFQEAIEQTTGHELTAVCTILHNAEMPIVTSYKQLKSHTPLTKGEIRAATIQPSVLGIDNLKLLEAPQTSGQIIIDLYKTADEYTLDAIPMGRLIDTRKHGLFVSDAIFDVSVQTNSNEITDNQTREIRIPISSFSIEYLATCTSLKKNSIDFDPALTPADIHKFTI